MRPQTTLHKIQDEKKVFQVLEPARQVEKIDTFSSQFSLFAFSSVAVFFLLLLFLPSPHRLPHSPPSLLLLSLELTSNSSERRGRRRGNEKRDGISVNTRKKKKNSSPNWSPNERNISQTKEGKKLSSIKRRHTYLR